MKRLLINIEIVEMSLLIMLLFTRCEDPIKGLDNNGITLLTVKDEFTNSPVADADVTVYRNEDDWAWERNPIKKSKTDSKGELLIEDIPNGDIYFDIISGSKNNWQYPYGGQALKGTVNVSEAYISYNINGVISDVDGKKWTIVKVTDASGKDLSEDPEYSHWINNQQTFEKSGYYASNEGTGNPIKTEGSWWGDWEYLYILLNGTDIYDYHISQLSDNSFVGTYYKYGTESYEEISLHYERVK